LLLLNVWFCGVKIYFEFFVLGKKAFTVPEPPPLVVLDEEAQLKADHSVFMQLRRVTIELGEMGDLHKVCRMHNK